MFDQNQGGGEKEKERKKERENGETEDGDDERKEDCKKKKGRGRKGGKKEIEPHGPTYRTGFYFRGGFFSGNGNLQGQQLASVEIEAGKRRKSKR